MLGMIGLNSTCLMVVDGGQSRRRWRIGREKKPRRAMATEMEIDETELDDGNRDGW